jgi:hypothetical protein
MRERLRSRFVDCSAMIERPWSERLAAHKIHLPADR